MPFYEDEKAARAAGEERAKRALMKQRQQTHRVSLDNLFDTLKAGELKTVNVIIKADVQGSVEALAASLLKIDVEGVRVNVVHSAVGAINESDITLAEASDAVVIGYLTFVLHHKHVNKRKLMKLKFVFTASSTRLSKKSKMP